MRDTRTKVRKKLYKVYYNLVDSLTGDTVQSIKESGLTKDEARELAKKLNGSEGTRGFLGINPKYKYERM